MKPNELRIGNLVWSNYGPYDRLEDYVVLIHEDFLLTKGHGKSNIAFHFIEPIPLTEEWLLKFGFENWDRGAWVNKTSLHKQDGLFWCHTYHLNEMCIEHVHQLQNLYFAFTGEELTIKEQ